MVGIQWTSTEQKKFLESHYSDFLKQQLKATLTSFWVSVNLEFLKRWPEIDVQYPGKQRSELSEQEQELLGIAVDKRKQVIKYCYISDFVSQLMP